MSGRLSPGPEARARLQALGEEEFQAFFDEIPPPAMQGIAKYLPSVDGFRNTSPAGIAKQKVALARKLRKANVGDRDFNALYLIWRTWIDANFENPKVVHEVMDKLEEAADKSPSVDERRIAVEQNVDAFLQLLKDESQQNHCTREQIERLFTFSPLPETSATRGLIAAAKTAAEVERDAALTELPKRLKIDEGAIERIKSELKSLSERLVLTNESVEPLSANLDKLQSKVAEVKASAKKAHDAVEALAQADAAVDLKIEALTSSVKSQRGEIRPLEPKLEDINTLRNKIARFADAQKTFEDSLRKQEQRVADLGSALDEIRRKQAEQPEGALEEKLRAFDERLCNLERRPAASRPPSAPLTQFYPDPQRHSVGLRWDSLVATDRTDVALLKSHTDLSRAIAGALQSLGLRKSAAQIFGEECSAAVIAKQAIFLRGSFATQTARAIGRVIGGPASVRIAMPLGLQDGEQLRVTVQHAFETERPTIGAIVIEGINRTALDITKEVLCDCLDPGFDRAPARSAVIGTISKGVASIQLELGYCDIGPVFDLNCLDWRAGQSPSAADAVSAFSADTDKSLFAQIGNANAETEEAIRLADAFVARRDPSIERAFLKAYRALHLVRTDIKTVTALQSLFFGWLMPYWLTLGVAKEQIEIEFDGGKVNGAAVDPRLTAMFKAGGAP